MWTGVLKMSQQFAFPTTLSALSNENAFRLRQELPPIIRIIGRIRPEIVSSYLNNLRESKAHDIIVLRLDNPGTFFTTSLISHACDK